MQFRALHPITLAVDKTQTAKSKGGRPKLNKKTVSIRLSEQILVQLKEAAASGGNLSAFVEEAIKDKLRKGRGDGQ